MKRMLCFALISGMIGLGASGTSSASALPATVDVEAASGIVAESSVSDSVLGSEDELVPLSRHRHRPPPPPNYPWWWWERDHRPPPPPPPPPPHRRHPGDRHPGGHHPGRHHPPGDHHRPGNHRPGPRPHSYVQPGMAGAGVVTLESGLIVALPEVK